MVKSVSYGRPRWGGLWHGAVARCVSGYPADRRPEEPAGDRTRLHVRCGATYKRARKAQPLGVTGHEPTCHKCRAAAYSTLRSTASTRRLASRPAADKFETTGAR